VALGFSGHWPEPDGRILKLPTFGMDKGGGVIGEFVVVSSSSVSLLCKTCELIAEKYNEYPNQKNVSNFTRFCLKSAKRHQQTGNFGHFSDQNGLNLNIFWSGWKSNVL